MKTQINNVETTPINEVLKMDVDWTSIFNNQSFELQMKLKDMTHEERVSYLVSFWSLNKYIH